MIEIGDSGVGMDKVLIDPSVCIFAVHLAIKLLYLIQSRDMSIIWQLWSDRQRLCTFAFGIQKDSRRGLLFCTELQRPC